MNSDRRPSHEEIADKLRQRIRTGQLVAGTRLPTQAKLAEEFHVDRGTVRHALLRLKADGLLTDVSKGRPPRVAEQRPSPEEGVAALVGLAPRLEDAFSVPHVRIDAVCLTAETLMRSMHAPIRLIQMETVRPESVEARIVLPRKNARRHYPAPEGGWGLDRAVDDAVHQRSVEQHERQITVLEGQFRMLRTTYGIRTSLEFRVGDGTPFHKLYLLNGTEVLFAHYIIGSKPEDVDGRRMTLRDAWGTESRLFSFRAQNGPRDGLFVEDTTTWFERLWNTLGPDDKGA